MTKSAEYTDMSIPPSGLSNLHLSFFLIFSAVLILLLLAFKPRFYNHILYGYLACSLSVILGSFSTFDLYRRMIRKALDVNYILATTADGIFCTRSKHFKVFIPWNNVCMVKKEGNHLSDDNLLIGKIKQKEFFVVDSPHFNKAQAKEFLESVNKRITPIKFKYRADELTHCPRCFKKLLKKLEDSYCPKCGNQFDNKCRMYHWYANFKVNNRMNVFFQYLSTLYLPLIFLFGGGWIIFMVVLLGYLGIYISLMLYLYGFRPIRKRLNRVKDFTLATSKDGVIYSSGDMTNYILTPWLDKTIKFEDGIFYAYFDDGNGSFALNTIPVPEEQSTEFLEDASTRIQSAKEQIKDSSLLEEMKKKYPEIERANELLDLNDSDTK